MEQGKCVDVVYTDFSKAFDKCETGVLLHRIRECGISGKVGLWIAAFLDSAVRKQAVGVQGRLSTLVSVISGVPKGIVLGPFLFLIHLLGISDNIFCETAVSSFADDTRLLRGVGSLRDCQSLQEDLSSLYSWASEVGMSFNAGKFEHLRFGSTEENVFQYLAPDGSIIQTKESLRDLGVRIISNLSFT